MALAALLFDGCPKHVTAEQVHAALRRNRTRVSLATVYNALHQFTDAGLLREVMIDPGRVYFDTHTETHHHFFDETSGQLHDISAKDVRLARLPKLPRGRKLNRVDIVIRVCTDRG
jgi:Fur family iron response transcriptional regulator